jgi:hypothetical protein
LGTTQHRLVSFNNLSQSPHPQPHHAHAHELLPADSSQVGQLALRPKRNRIVGPWFHFHPKVTRSFPVFFVGMIFSRKEIGMESSDHTMFRISLKIKLGSSIVSSPELLPARRAVTPSGFRLNPPWALICAAFGRQLLLLLFGGWLRIHTGVD